jgi:hypothetical protein
MPRQRSLDAIAAPRRGILSVDLKPALPKRSESAASQRHGKTVFEISSRPDSGCSTC